MREKERPRRGRFCHRLVHSQSEIDRATHVPEAAVKAER